LIICACFSKFNHTDNVSRVAYDRLVDKLAGNVAAVSSGLENLSARVSAPQTTPDQAEVNTLHPSIAISPPPSTSGCSDQRYTRCPLPQLDPKDYPDIKHWEDDEYNVIRKGAKRGGEAPTPITGTSALSCFMEDENGSPIPEKERRNARERAKKLWGEVLRMGRATPQWGDIPQDVQDEHIHILESEFPWFRLCANHWKAKMVATNGYGQWYGPALRRRLAAQVKTEGAEGSVKSEGFYQDNDIDSSGAASK
jgi:hypothetical protein